MHCNTLQQILTHSNKLIECEAVCKHTATQWNKLNHGRTEHTATHSEYALQRTATNWLTMRPCANTLQRIETNWNTLQDPHLNIMSMDFGELSLATNWMTMRPCVSTMQHIAAHCNTLKKRWNILQHTLRDWLIMRPCANTMRVLRLMPSASSSASGKLLLRCMYACVFVYI